MNIDWFTFVAQLVNFLVLVALLRWLLYRPIVRAMKKREAKIARRLKEADRERQAAEEKGRQYEDKSRRIDRQREGLLEQARQKAQQEQQRLLNEAKQEIEHRREQWRDALRRDQDDLVVELRRQAGEMALHAARRTLAQLADVELESRMCDAFASRFEQLGKEQREEIRRHLGNGEAKVSIRSGFELSSAQRRRLGETIRATFAPDAEIAFERTADLISGLALDVGGYSFGWNVSDFLRDLETEFAERLKEKR